MADIHIGYLSDFSERRARTVQWNGTEWAVFLLSDGTFRAIENSCPHKAGKLSEGIVCDHHVFCPLHDWKIDMNDGQVQAPDSGCVAKLEVYHDVETGKIFLRWEAGSLKKSS